MSVIVCLSGKKRSGKNTAANYIAGSYLEHKREIHNFTIDKSGLLHVRISNGSPWVTIQENEFSVFNFKHVKFYSFADPLKAFCMDVFGLTYEQCYGTEDEKNSLTNIQFRDLPQVNEKLDIECGERLTARRILQYFGTDIVRKMCPDAWINATISKIKRENPELAIITDARFPNEINGINHIGGHSIRLLRDVCEDDPHPSEKALDDFPVVKYHYVVNNQTQTVAEQNQQIGVILSKIMVGA